MDINNNIHIILKSIFRTRVYSGKVKVRLNPLPALFWCRGCESTGGVEVPKNPQVFAENKDLMVFAASSTVSYEKVP